MEREEKEMKSVSFCFDGILGFDIKEMKRISACCVKELSRQLYKESSKDGGGAILCCRGHGNCILPENRHTHFIYFNYCVGGRRLGPINNNCAHFSAYL